MEVIRGRERDCRQEIRGSIERGGAREALGVNRSGKRSAQLLTKARILLKADVSEAGEGWSDSKIAAALDTSIANVERTRRQLVEEGFEAVLTRKYNPRCAPRRIFDGVAEAKLIALVCGSAPEGYARWTLSLLEKKVVELNMVEKASDNTDRTHAQKNILKPHLRQQWVIPPQANAGFVANMEDVDLRLFCHSTNAVTSDPALFA